MPQPAGHTGFSCAAGCHALPHLLLLSQHSAAGSQAGGGDGFDGSADFAESASVAQKKLNGFLVTLYKERWEDSKRFMIGRVLLEHLQLLLILLQPQFLWTFDTSYW